jgi:hypothetical protein
VRAVGGKYGPQVPLAEDQDAVGELGPGGQHESFGVAVRFGTAGWIFTVSMPAPARTASNEVVNWPVVPPIDMRRDSNYGDPKS